MANEVMISCDLFFNDATFDNTELASLGAVYSPGTLKYTRIKMTIGITETVLVLGNLTVLGYAQFINRDPTNTIHIKNQAGGSRIITCLPTDVNGKGLPNTFNFGPDITAPVAIALVAPCSIEYLLVNT